MIKHLIYYPGPIVAQFKANCFEIVLSDAALVRSLIGEELLTSEWVRCQSSTIKNLGKGWYIVAISVKKANNYWETHQGL